MEDAAADGVPWIPVSWGELLDKISILELKATRIEDPARLRNVERELALLRAVRDRAMPVFPEGVGSLSCELAAVNGRLWDVEDEIRLLDRQGEFGLRFAELARAVYRTNDRRAAIKRQIDQLTGSALVEEKWYPAARGGNSGS
jgi:hypothetical protein